MKSILLFFLFCLSPKIWATPVWSEVRQEVIAAQPSQQDVLQIPLQITVDASSVWAAPGEIQRQVAKASGIFRQCGIELGRVEVHYVSFSPDIVSSLNNPNPYRGPGALGLVTEEMSATRPAMWLFGTQIPSTAQAFTQTSIERLSEGPSVEVAPLLNTTLISGHHHSNAPVPGAHASYSTFAHELAHLLGDLDHVDEMDNLMSSETRPRSKTGRLSAAQCQQMRTYSMTRFIGLGDTLQNLGLPPRGCVN